ncbi:hypothetical protein ACU19_06560 [Actinobaculum suis]|uniref:glycosyltransferase n=1 Tax=Actinobaculum suis TaxID=1657 RepID=UPI00066FC772|nr:glycosyltransferase [Actinobaculum suis]KMY23034.1 hypothetical protein ACU19_06560 [Actinobaculum suis]
MRIMQVSAHYPPDFVSGGTLIPQRFAKASAERGHEAFVFTGGLNNVAPLKTLDTEEEGIPVRWVGVSQFLSRSDEKNYNNPEVAEEFQAYVEEVRPDLVHFHSIQTLGAQCLRIAHEAGATVIVTMHDFWWVCPQQFLIDGLNKPVSLVVDCGEADWGVEEQWVTQRNDWLSQQLEFADLIMAPSHIAAQVLVANGVPEEKMRVNENGIDNVSDPSDATEISDILAARRTRGEAPVRFMYAGGDNVLKGRDVLAAATQKAQVPAGTTLDLYQTKEFGFASWAQSKPAYSRDEVSEVFNSHDVLILPSIARESHSIVTREALAAGMTVIVSTSLGPEEAVADGVNGVCVPTGDTDALARAIEKLANPATLRTYLGKGSASPIVTITAQIDELFGYYEEATAIRRQKTEGVPVVSAVRQLIQNVVFVIGIQGAPARYRAHLPAEGLRKWGITTEVLHYRDPHLEEKLLAADAVVFYRVPATKQVLKIIDVVRESSRTIPILGDIDDLIFDPSLEPYLDNLERLTTEERDLWRRGIYRYRTTLEHCDFFIGSTDTVSAEGHRLLGVPTRRFWNGVGTLLARSSDRATQAPRTSGPLRIGYFSGTDTHDADWRSIEEPIARVLKQRPDVELWLGGMVEPSERLAEFKDRVVRIPFQNWWDLPKKLRDVDVNLAPLTMGGAGQVFNDAKSSIKWLEAALALTPTVATPTEPFRESIVDGETGLLANSAEEWEQAILGLLDDAGRRQKIAFNARRWVLLNLSPALQGARYRDLLVEAWGYVAREGHREPSAFESVYDDEPLSELDSAVEPYVIPASGKPMSRTRMLLLKSVDSLRREGVRGFAVRVLRKIRP